MRLQKNHMPVEGQGRRHKRPRCRDVSVGAVEVVSGQILGKLLK